MKYIYTISFLLFYLISYGQISNCGTIAPETIYKSKKSQSSDCQWCDDIPGMIEDCDEIWINVTMHFISNGDCSEGVQWQWEDSDGYDATIDADEAIDRAQNMFDDANALLEGMDESVNWGMDCWPTEGGETYTEPLCMPLRFRFAGVEFHCNEELSDSSSTGIFLSNSDEHVHITFSEYAGSGNGVANPANNTCMIENFSGDLLTHEILHLFDIHHTSAGHANGCDDLPIFPEDMTWDNPYNSQTEDIDNCYLGEPTYYNDETGETIDLCDPAIFNHDIHPCCDSCNYSNNTMSYSGFNNIPGVATLSPCQINTVLNSLCEDNCELIHTVIPENGCPPATAFAFQPPGLLYEYEDCQICFSLTGSDLATAHYITMFDDLGNNIYQGPWVKEEPSSFCIASTSDNSWAYGIEANSSYSLVLTVRNKCGDFDQFTLEFTTPGDCDELVDPCYNLPPEITSTNTIVISNQQVQREYCWSDVGAEFYEFTYQLPGMEPVTTVVYGTCFMTPILTISEFINIEISGIVPVCDCSEDPPSFEIDITGNPCNENSQLCLNLSGDLSSEFYEVEWYGPDGLIFVSQNGPTCMNINPDMPDGNYYAIITLYWGPQYKKVKCSAVSASVSKNCGCPGELILDYSVNSRSLCKGDLQVCVSDDYGYLGGSNQYYTITWFFDGLSSGVSANAGECMTFPPGVEDISVSVTYYTGPEYKREICTLKGAISFNCECPEDIVVEASKDDCKTFCIETIPEDLLTPGYFTATWTSFGLPPQVSTSLCKTFSQNGHYTLRLEIYSDPNREFLLCTLRKIVRVDCNADTRDPLFRNDESLVRQLSAYPNPFQDKFYIESPEEIKGGTLVIYNALGKVMFTKNLGVEEEDPLEISTEAFGAGLYMVKIYNDTGIQFETKMIKLN